MNLKIRFANDSNKRFLEKNTKLSVNHINSKIINNEIIIAEVDGIPIGYLIVDYLWCRVPFISFIQVDKNFRSKGVGKSQLIFLEKYLINEGQTELFSSSEETAAKAQAWHRKMGFTDSGIVQNINKNDESELYF